MDSGLGDLNQVVAITPLYILMCVHKYLMLCVCINNKEVLLQIILGYFSLQTQFKYPDYQELDLFDLPFNWMFMCIINAKISAITYVVLYTS